MLVRTTGVVIINGDKVLLVKHKEGAEHLTGAYGIPAGRVEEGESLSQAAAREVLEEVGLIVKEGDLIPIPKEYRAEIERKDGSTKLFSLEPFVTNSYEGSPKESSESTPEWVDISKLEELALLPNMSKVVKEGAMML